MIIGAVWIKSGRIITSDTAGTQMRILPVFIHNCFVVLKGPGTKDC